MAIVGDMPVVLPTTVSSAPSHDQKGSSESSLWNGMSSVPGTPITLGDLAKALASLYPASPDDIPDSACQWMTADLTLVRRDDDLSDFDADVDTLEEEIDILESEIARLQRLKSWQRELRRAAGLPVSLPLTTNAKIPTFDDERMLTPLFLHDPEVDASSLVMSPQSMISTADEQQVYNELFVNTDHLAPTHEDYTSRSDSTPTFSPLTTPPVSPSLTAFTSRTSVKRKASSTPATPMPMSTPSKRHSSSKTHSGRITREMKEELVEVITQRMPREKVLGILEIVSPSAKPEPEEEAEIVLDVNALDESMLQRLIKHVQPWFHPHPTATTKSARKPSNRRSRSRGRWSQRKTQNAEAIRRKHFKQEEVVHIVSTNEEGEEDIDIGGFDDE